MQLAVGPLARRQPLDEPGVPEGDGRGVGEQSRRLDLELAEGFVQSAAHPEDSAGRAVVHDRGEQDRGRVRRE